MNSWKEGPLRCDRRFCWERLHFEVVVPLVCFSRSAVHHTCSCDTRASVRPDSGSISMYNAPGCVRRSHTTPDAQTCCCWILNTHITASSSTADAEQSRRGEWGNTDKKYTGHLSPQSHKEIRKYSILRYKYFTLTLFIYVCIHIHIYCTLF